jgi:ribonuclease BN (tRNA processing enzyme)
MKVKIIGGQGGVTPTTKATSYLIDGVLLIDAGSVASGISIEKQTAIDNILISHSHLDHISDLAFLADNCFGLKDRPFEVYCNEKIRENIMTHLLNDAIWPDFTKLPNPQNPTLRFHSVVPEQVFDLGPYRVRSVPVNHQAGAQGFIVEKEGKSLVFTQDTGPTSRIWELAHKCDQVVGIFTEVSFPNHMEQVAIDSQHHTPATMKKEIQKMPQGVPIHLGHLKPSFQQQLVNEVNALGCPDLIVMSEDDTTFEF